MATLSQLRQQYPQYDDMSDQQLADSFHSKFYTDMPKEEFYKRLEYSPEKSPMPARGDKSGSDTPPSASVPVEKSLGGTFLSGIKAAGAGAIGTLAEIVDPTPMWGLERVGSPVVPDLSKTKTAAAQVVDQQRANYADGLVGQGLGYTTEVIANPINYVGGRGANVVKEAGSAVAGTVPKILARTGQGAVEGSLQGVGTEDSRTTNAALGAGGAAALTGLVAGGKGAINAAVPKVAEEVATLAQRAKDFGIPVSVQQLSPTKIRSTAQKVSSAVPFSGVQGFEDTQRAAFNRALASTIGEQSDNLGPDTIKNYLSRTNQGFDNVLKGQSIQVGDDAVRALDNINANAADSVTGDLADIVRRNIDKLKADITDGVISGEKLASYRSQLIKRAANAQAGAKEFLGDLVDEIDDLAERGLGQESVDQLKTLRREYRNFKTIEPLLEKSPDGMINPTDLQQKVASSKFIKSSRLGVGDDDLVDLARIGKQLLVKQGGSDTFEKASLLGQGAGGLAGVLNPVLGAKILGGVALNRAFQSFYNQSPSVIESVIKRSIGSKGDEAIKLIKKGAPLNAVSDSLKKSGVAADKVNSAMSEMTSFVSKDLPFSTNEAQSGKIQRKATK